MLCRGPEALGKGPETLGKGIAKGCPRQRSLGKVLDGKGVFAEGPLSGTRQRKAAVMVPVPLAVSLPRAGLRQRKFFIFLRRPLPRAGPRHRIFFIF